KIGKSNDATGRARSEAVAEAEHRLDAIVTQQQLHGANRVEVADADLELCTVDGVLPAGLYSTTNLPTEVRVEGRWIGVENPEMDCGLVVLDDGRVRAEPMHRVRSGDRVVVGQRGVRVQ